MQILQNRRQFVAGLSAVGAGVFGPRASFAADPPPETTTIRLAYDPSICIAPGQIAEALLRAEGFIDIRYIESLADQDAIARGEIDFAMETAAWVVSQLDAGSPVTALAGLHPGCYELSRTSPSGPSAISKASGSASRTPGGAGTCCWRSWRRG